MQNAIDDLLRLNGCDEVIPPHHHHIANAVHPTGVAPVAVGGASSSTHHYEPVTGSGGVAAGGLPSLKNGSEPLQPALEFPSNKGGR
ncbi:Uncharacterized protein APZ42_030767 [Daphnia magna]|uniref:Uncharacterized protein n=1 Tax=Daphnia magna TaxID=35525 RepID=A0A164NAZ1_9CRUS|nr:Uncharacterized protein APZ42_030767 [Daphnia magna]